jgi:hypothetical protein
MRRPTLAVGDVPQTAQTNLCEDHHTQGSDNPLVPPPPSNSEPTRRDRQLHEDSRRTGENTQGKQIGTTPRIGQTTNDHTATNPQQTRNEPQNQDEKHTEDDQNHDRHIPDHDDTLPKQHPGIRETDTGRRPQQPPQHITNERHPRHHTPSLSVSTALGSTARNRSGSRRKKLIWLHSLCDTRIVAVG